ncbi:MAG: MazG family protein [Gordonia sp. (in: high G+C Gram-positive bacteria)]|uniref:MazG family protein n=1 Tax=Gordonia sp. (in: high G+C Gram-positive bacteria) TaxID=84139 RepID=UPI0039E69D80
MTVVLLDPQHPDMVPVSAVKLLSGPVQVTEDVDASVLWAFPRAQAAQGDDGDPMTVLLSTDPDHPFVRARADRGEVVLGRTDPPPPRPGETLLDAVALMDRLRTTGPWEQRQTHESLRRFLLEEVYEVLDAIDVGTTDDLRDELGDLLLQVLFHARVAADDPTDPFDIDDVAQAFIDKVTRRTPGVLSGEHNDLRRQIADWETAKAAERQRGSILDGIVTTAPALALAQKVLERVAENGFPRSQVDPGLLDVSVEMGSDSVEDATRQRALDLMDMVYTAEARAKQDGVTLSEPAQWLHYLGVDAPPAATAAPATAAPAPAAPAPTPAAPAPAAPAPAAPAPTPAATAPPTPAPPTTIPVPTAPYPEQPDRGPRPTAPRTVEGDGTADAERTVTQFPVVIQPASHDPIIVEKKPTKPAKPKVRVEDKAAKRGKAPVTVRESDEPEVTSTVPRPANADSLTARPKRRPEPDDPSGQIVFSTE